MTQHLDSLLTKRCSKLLSIDSTTGNETAIIDHLQEWAGNRSLFAPEEQTRLGNTLILGQPDDSRPCIGLFGHVDTVASLGGFPEVRLHGDRLSGLGASDMKGGIAVMQALAEELDPHTLPFALVMVFYSGEEGNYEDNSLQHLVGRSELIDAIDLAVLLEPTDGSIEVGCLGSLRATVTFNGTAAHSARPWQGDNAITKSAALLSYLQARPRRDEVVEGMSYTESIGVTRIEGGGTGSVVPERCQLLLDYRFAPHVDATPARTTAKFRAELEDVIEGASLEVLEIAHASPPPRGNPLIDHLLHHSHAPLGPRQGWTDVARLASAGIDAVNFGPGETEQAHRSHESISVESMRRCFDALKRTITAPLEGVL